MNRKRISWRSVVLLLGVLASAVLLVLAAARYPGGYDWFDQSVSSLFQPTALNGAHNTSRSLAAAGVLLFCPSMAIVFTTIRGAVPPDSTERPSRSRASPRWSTRVSW